MMIMLGTAVPLQTVPPPESDAVGSALTLTFTGVPSAVAGHVLASVSAVIVYVPTGAFAMANVFEG